MERQRSERKGHRQEDGQDRGGMERGTIDQQKMSRLEGDPSKAKRVLGWKHKYDLKALVKEMVQSDIDYLQA